MLDAPIISTVANQIPTKELLTRLQRIADTLSGVDQTDASLDTYRQLASDLANKKLLSNKNKGIQAYACCALADILRIYAPDAPFSPETLTSVFKAFINQISQLWNEDNPYYPQQCHILKRIVEVRSVILVADLPDCESLVINMFDSMYSLAGKGISSRLEPLVAEMLSEMVSEADFIPQRVVGLVLKKLVVPTSYPVAGDDSNISNTAFSFSLAVCEANIEKMARFVAQHFSEMLDASVSHSKQRSSNKESSFEALQKIHSSSINIWAHLPELLSSVMGLISDELNSDSEKIRLLATRSIGSMLSSSSTKSSTSSATHFISAHKTTWATWLNKSVDVSAVVRCGWVDQIAAILNTQTLTSDEMNKICEKFCKCLLDANEKVRLTTCRAFKSLALTLFMSKLCNEESLNSFLILCREKHVDIRNEAINFLAELYNFYQDRKLQGRVIDFGNLTKTQMDSVEKLVTSSIPNSIIHLNYVNDKLLTATVDVVLFEQLVPFNDDATTRISRFCLFYQHLDTRGKAAFAAINHRQKKFVEVLLKFVDFAEDFGLDSSLQAENKENVSLDAKKNRDKLISSVEKIVQWLSISFPVGIQSHDCIYRLFRLKNLRLINLLKNSINSLLDYKSVKNSIKEVLLKVAEEKTIKLEGDSSRISTIDMISNMKILLYRSAFILNNKTNVAKIIDFCSDTDSPYAKVANEMICDISNTFPASFRNHAKALIDAIVLSENPVQFVSLSKTLCRFGKRFPENLPLDGSFLDFLAQSTLGDNSLQARYALKLLLCYGNEAETQITTIRSSIFPFSAENSSASHISVAAELFKSKTLDLSAEWNATSSFVIEEILRKNSFEESEKLRSIDWIGNDKIEDHPDLNRKLYSVQLLVNKVRSLDADSSSPIIDKTLKLLCTIISNNGEIVRAESGKSTTHDCFKAHLRLSAGLGFLKLAQISNINAILSQEMLWRVSRLLRDEKVQVREAFFGKLKKLLHRKSISERFLFLVFMLGHDPDENLRQAARTWIMSQHTKAILKKDICFETVFTRLAFAIAQDELFLKHFEPQEGESVSQEESVPQEGDSEPQDLKAYLYAMKYITMYLETVAKESNCSLLYYLASRIKQYRCSGDSGFDSSGKANLSLYRVAELCQLLTKEFSDVKGWTIQTYPGKIGLPSDIFTPIDNFDEALEVISQMYITETVQVEIREAFGKPRPSRTKRNTGQKLAQSVTKKKRRIQQPRDDDDDNGEDDQNNVSLPRRASSRVKKEIKYTEGSETELSENSDGDSDFT